MGEGNVIFSHFFDRSTHTVRQSVVIEDIADGVAYIKHEHAESAVRLIRAGAFLVVGLANAANWSERTVHEADHLSDRDAVHRLVEKIPAVPSSLGCDQAILA